MQFGGRRWHAQGLTLTELVTTYMLYALHNYSSRNITVGSPLTEPCILYGYVYRYMYFELDNYSDAAITTYSVSIYYEYEC